MAVISDRKLKIIKRRYGFKSVSELADELNLQEKDVRRAIKKMGLKVEKEGIAEAEESILGEHSLRWTIAAALLMVLCSGICFGASIKFPFVFDDHHSIFQNRYIRDMGNVGDFFVDPQTFSNQPERRMYRPLLLLTYAVNYAIGKYNDMTYWHVFNFAVHALNGFLVFLILDLLLGYRPLSLLLSALFVSHPVVVEPVVYLSARSTLLAGTFLFGAIYCFFRYSRSDGGLPWAVAVAVLYLAGILCKENVFMLPAVLLVGEYLLGNGFEDFIGKERWKVHAPLWAIAFGYLLFRKYGISIPTVVLERPDRPFSAQIFTQGGVWLDYLRKILWPVGLNNQPSVQLARSLWVGGRGIMEQPVLWFLTWAVMGALVALGRRNRRMVWGVAFSVIILLPETLITMNQLSNERRMYLPLFGVMIVVGSLFGGRSSKSGPRSIILMGLISAVVLLLAPMSIDRTREWRNEKVLWFNSISRAPDSPTSWHGLGYVYGQEDDYRRALWALDQALAIDRNYTLSLRLKGAVLLTTNRPEEALKNLERAVKIERLAHRGWYNLGLAYSRLDREEEAIRAYKTAIELNRFYALPHNNLAAIYIKQGKYEEARRELEISISLEPDNEMFKEKLRRFEKKLKRLKRNQGAEEPGARSTK